MSRMNHHTKQAMRSLRLEVASLRQINEQLLEDFEQAGYDADEARRHAEQASWDAHQESERARHACDEARETERRAENRHYEQQAAVRDLERARDWQRVTGSPTAHWDIERAVNRLKRL